MAAGNRWDLGGRDPDALYLDAQRSRGESTWAAAKRRLRKNRLAWFSWTFLCCVGVISLIAPLLPLPSPKTIYPVDEPKAPSWPWQMPLRRDFQPDYWDLNPIDASLVELRTTVFGKMQTGAWLGTDARGRDLLARIVWGSRTSLLVALAATLVSLVIGVTYGAVAGLAGGRLDRWMMRALDVLYSLPLVFLVIFFLAVLDAPRAILDQPLMDREQLFCLLIGVAYWLTIARVVRGQVLSLERSEFIQAARAMGASSRHILVRHVLPKVISVAVVYLTLTIPAVILAEAFLSFLGLGIAPPKVSWGVLAVDGIDAINPIHTYWWLFTFPSVAMGSTLLALSLLGDGLREALDPRQQTSG